jgi:hypothetical protein
MTGTRGQAARKKSLMWEKPRRGGRGQENSIVQLKISESFDVAQHERTKNSKWISQSGHAELVEAFRISMPVSLIVSRSVRTQMI